MFIKQILLRVVATIDMHCKMQAAFRKMVQYYHSCVDGVIGRGWPPIAGKGKLNCVWGRDWAEEGGC